MTIPVTYDKREIQAIVAKVRAYCPVPTITRAICLTLVRGLLCVATSVGPFLYLFCRRARTFSALPSCRSAPTTVATTPVVSFTARSVDWVWQGTPVVRGASTRWASCADERPSVQGGSVMVEPPLLWVGTVVDYVLAKTDRPRTQIRRIALHRMLY